MASKSATHANHETMIAITITGIVAVLGMAAWFASGNALFHNLIQTGLAWCL